MGKRNSKPASSAQDEPDVIDPDRLSEERRLDWSRAFSSRDDVSGPLPPGFDLDASQAGSDDVTAGPPVIQGRAYAMANEDEHPSGTVPRDRYREAEDELETLVRRTVQDLKAEWDARQPEAESRPVFWCYSDIWKRAYIGRDHDELMKLAEVGQLGGRPFAGSGWLRIEGDRVVVYGEGISAHVMKALHVHLLPVDAPLVEEGDPDTGGPAGVMLSQGTRKALKYLHAAWQDGGTAPRTEFFWCFVEVWGGRAFLGLDYGQLVKYAAAIEPDGQLKAHGFLRIEGGELVVAGVGISSAALDAMSGLLEPIGAPLTVRSAVQSGIAVPDDPSGPSDAALDAPAPAAESDERPWEALMAECAASTHQALSALQAQVDDPTARRSVRWAFVPGSPVLLLCVDDPTFDRLVTALEQQADGQVEEGMIEVYDVGLVVYGRPSDDARKVMGQWLEPIEVPLFYEHAEGDEGSDEDFASFGDELAVADGEPWEPEGLQEPLVSSEGDQTADDGIALTLSDQVALPNAEALANLGPDGTTWLLHGPWLLLGASHSDEVVEQLPYVSGSGTLTRADEGTLMFAGAAEADRSLIADYMRDTFELAVYFEEDQALDGADG